ncbi:MULTISPECIES: alpha/beta fold hydrolase [unclassified Variovorax]|uniref:alpha/beta fold hydrolase n=1 Tax=unclassified Variovorax TaxID=663243 RepID=UPI00257616B7|nr:MULTISPECIES: alpha/beta fold hydrolase [unclassified Variovorax]MDM0091619.1 alpha/beta fold hydrolase [Variovorax sp. J22G40]MDM0145975.1 alpha/beta fold hydrolase [Variovorax sp. J2P1-31]
MPRLVLLPGLACDERLWQAQRPALPPRFDARVSDVHTRHERIEHMAAAVLAENEGPLILCGASLGGMVAMAAAQQAPERVVGLALLGTSARPETPEMFQLRELAIEMFERGEARELIELNANFALHPAQVADKALVRRYVEMVLDAGVTQLVRQNRAAMQRPDARRHLPAVRCPVLVLCGDGDKLTPPECSSEIAGLVPQAELQWITQAGHMLTMEQPAQVNAALLHWLRRWSADA